MRIAMDDQGMRLFIIATEIHGSHCSSVTTVTELRAERTRFESRQEQNWHFILFATASRPNLGPTQPHIQWVPGAPTPGVKRSWREADHSHLSSVEIKSVRSYTSTPQYVFMAWCLVKHRENFTFCWNTRIRAAIPPFHQHVLTF